MKKLIGGAAAIALLMTAGLAQAAEIKGTVTAINGNTRTMSVEGKSYYFPSMVPMTGIKVGDTVTLTYDTMNSRNTVSKAVK